MKKFQDLSKQSFFLRFLEIISFIFLFLAELLLLRLSLVVVSGIYFLLAMCRLLTAVWWARAPGLVGSSSRSAWAQWLWLPGARGWIVVAHGLSCSAGCGIFADQGSIPCLLRLQVDYLPLSHQGNPKHHFNFWATPLTPNCTYHLPVSLTHTHTQTHTCTEFSFHWQPWRSELAFI